MKKHFISILAILLLLPVIAQASIKFTVTNVKNSSHEGHTVKTPVFIDDISNYENVLAIGYPNVLFNGLASGASKSITWNSGYIFRTNISGYYTVYAACNLDRHIYAEPAMFPQMFIPDNTNVDIKVNCNVIDGHTLKEPETTITFSHQK